VLTVHDELVAEVPQPVADATLSTVLDVMADPPAWGRGIPLSAAGSIMPRYGKLE
jgi:hypothetical protein